MPSYKVNKDAVKNAEKLISNGSVDTETEWSDAAPSTDDQNKVIEKEGYAGYGRWHLGIDEEASDETKGKFGFPFGDFKNVNRAALIHAKQRAAQNGHDEVEKAADGLLQRLDDKKS